MRRSDWSSDVCSSDLIAHVGPKGFHLAASDLERALGGNRGEAEITGPVELPAVGTYGHQCHVGMVVGQCAEVLQLEIKGVVQKFDGLAGAQVLKMHVTAGQFDPVDSQGKWLGVRVGGGGFAGR